MRLWHPRRSGFLSGHGHSSKIQVGTGKGEKCSHTRTILDALTEPSQDAINQDAPSARFSRVDPTLVIHCVRLVDWSRVVVASCPFLAAFGMLSTTMFASSHSFIPLFISFASSYFSSISTRSCLTSVRFHGSQLVSLIPHLNPL